VGNKKRCNGISVWRYNGESIPKIPLRQELNRRAKFYFVTIRFPLQKGKPMEGLSKRKQNKILWSQEPTTINRKPTKIIKFQKIKTDVMKINSKALIISLLVVTFGACSDKATSQEKQATTSSKADNEGLTLIKNTCYACHNPNTKSHDDIIAPPLIAVKKRYSMAYPSKDEFVREMTNWIVNPTKDMALMRGAVDKFNVMPNLSISKEDAEKMANYIFNNDIEAPAWFAEHEKQQHGNGKGKGHAGQGGRANAWMSEIALVDGKKWKSDDATMKHIDNLKQIIAENKVLDDEAALKGLAKKLTGELDLLFNDCTMEGPDHNALHKYLVALINKKDMLRKVDINKGWKVVARIQEQLNDYERFFQ